MAEKFESDHFRFTDGQFQLVRSKFPYKKIAFESISKITITKSVSVKSPLKYTLIGILLLAVAFFIIVKMSDITYLAFIDNMSVENHVSRYRAILSIMLIAVFLIPLGTLSLVRAYSKTWVLTIYCTDGSMEIQSLKHLVKSKKIFMLTRYLRDQFKNTPIIVIDHIG